MKTPIILAATGLLLSSCGEKNKNEARRENTATTPVIAVVNYPLAYFAERLAGDFASVLFEAPRDEDPAFWKPTDAEVEKIQGADLILLNGASYAKWTATAILPYEASVVTTDSFEADLIEIEGSVKHTHGEDEEAHTHSGTAFTTWMDFKQASAQAAAIANALIEQFPDREASVRGNLTTLQQDLVRIDEAMNAATRKLQAAPLLASHPVYHYWERAYDLKIASLLWEPEMELTAEAMADLQKARDAHPGCRYFIWEGQPSPQNLAKIESAGLTSVVISPCGNRPESGDFLRVMEANIAALEALPGGAPASP